MSRRVAGRRRGVVLPGMAAALFALVLGVTAGVGTVDRSASPQPGATPTPISAATPSAGECRAEPRSFEEIEALREEAAATPPVPRTPGPVLSGRPADAATVAIARASIEELLACFATGEPLRVWGLYSDPHLARLLSRQRGFDRRLYDAYATPRPAGPDERVRLVELEDVVRLDDGRVGATVVLFYPGLGLEKRFYFVWFAAGDRWLIDEIVGEITFSVP